MIRALLIEDEPAARADLRALLGAFPHITVVAEADTFARGQALLQFGGYDLVFLDIHLIGGNGLDLAPFVHEMAKLVFVTAYEHHALRAFDVNAMDYLLKPIAAPRLAACLKKVFAISPGSTPQMEGESLDSGEPVSPLALKPLRIDDQAFLKTGPLTGRFARVSEIGVISSCGNYTEVSLAAGPVLLVRRTLKEWESLLPSAVFVRAHRTVIVNTARIVSLKRASVAVTHLQLDGLAGTTKLSFRYLAGVRERLAARGFS